MFIMFSMVLCVLLLILVLKGVSMLLSESVFTSREELSSYECGFEPNNLSRVPFSLRYFFLTLVFLLFDLEVVLMLFIGFFLLSNYVFFNLVILIIFVFVLFLGLIYEWQDGTLDWLS